MSRLRKILDVKQTEVAALLPHEARLRREALQRNDFRSFASAIDRGHDELGLIAEVKKASPSAGVIAENFNPIEIARAYERAGAHAISVLTDVQFFQGHLEYLVDIRRETNLPVLRKDFIIHPVQIYEAVCAGADAILLIVAALDQRNLKFLLDSAATFQLDVLVEVHSFEELERALEAEAQIIGINNRNLATFEVDIATTEQLSEEVPDGMLLVAESGIKTRDDSQRMFDCGVNALLVGETLMRAPDVSAAVADLLAVEVKEKPAE